jgi:hypothetical protein
MPSTTNCVALKKDFRVIISGSFGEKHDPETAQKMTQKN